MRKWQPTVLNVWFLAGQAVVLSPLGKCPQGTCDDDWRHFWLSQLGGGCCWHLDGGGQGCCELCQDSPTAKNFLAPNISSAEVERSSVEAQAVSDDQRDHQALDIYRTGS